MGKQKLITYYPFEEERKTRQKRKATKSQKQNKKIVLIVLTIKPMEIGRATERWTLPIQNHSPIKKKQQNLMKKMFAATSECMNSIS